MKPVDGYRRWKKWLMVNDWPKGLLMICGNLQMVDNIDENYVNDCLKTNITGLVDNFCKSWLTNG